MPDPDSLPARLKHRRIYLNMTLDTVSDLLDISHTQVRRYELGTATIPPHLIPHYAKIMRTQESFFIEEDTLKQKKLEDSFDFRVSIGLSIKKHRKIKRITQANLAQAASLERSQLSRTENGFRSISAECLYKIATHLDTPIQDFFPSS